MPMTKGQICGSLETASHRILRCMESLDDAKLRQKLTRAWNQVVETKTALEKEALAGPN